MSQTIQPNVGPARRPRPKRTWRTLVAIAVVIAVAVGVALLLAQCANTGGAPGGGAGGGGGGRGGPGGGRGGLSITVGVATATLGDVPITVTALGTVTPEQTVSVIPRVTGELLQVRFTEGQLVNKGAVLAVIDPAPYQAALRQAQGTLTRDQATLAGAQRDLDRYRTLVAENSIAKQTAEDQAATVNQDKGVVASDEGSVATARLNLQWTQIVSPVSGRVGLRQIDAGNQVSANSSTPIAVVTQIDPIDVIFAVPEDAIPQIVKHPDFGAGLPVTAFDRSGGQTLATGSLATIDNIVDTTTGTVKGKARFANPNASLFPNQFVNITVLVDTLRNQVIVPSTAIRHGPNGDFVWVLNTTDGKTGTVRQQNVTSGPGTGETTSITQGLTAGQQVITDGGDRLKDGASVTLPRTGGGGGAAGGGNGGGAGNGATGGGNGGGGGGHHHGAGATNSTAPTNAASTNAAHGNGNGGGDVGIFGGVG